MRVGGPRQGNERSGNDDLMERIVERDNLLAALKRVRKNKGSAGIDGMGVDGLPGQTALPRKLFDAMGLPRLRPH
jgi:hypothetical protein